MTLLYEHRELAIQLREDIQESRKMRRSQVEKGKRNFPEEKVPEEWRRGGGGDRHSRGPEGSSVWQKLGSPVITDERLIRSFKVLWVVSGQTGPYKICSSSTPALLSLLFKICPQGTKVLSLVICTVRISLKPVCCFSWGGLNLRWLQPKK